MGATKAPPYRSATRAPRRAILISPSRNAAPKKGLSDHVSESGGTNKTVAAGRCNLWHNTSGAVFKTQPKV